MNLHRDHIAGGGLLIVALAVTAFSRDLEIGTLVSPGPGMLPHLAIGLIALFASVLLVGAGQSPAISELTWSDLSHAVRVTGVAAISAALYERHGFVLTMSLMIFALLVAVERVSLWRSALFAVGLTGGTYLLLAKLLKSPLPIGPFGI